MELEIYQNILIMVLITTFVMGWVVNKTDFCTMGAVSDWINMGSTLRLRSWALAICCAILVTTILSYLELIDMSLAESNDTSSPPYNTPMFAWSRYILGGFIFGVGMTIGSGCGNKTLVRIGGGNLKSIVILIAMAVGAYLMIFTNFGYDVFLQWTSSSDIDLTDFNMDSQDLGAFTSAVLSSDPHNNKIIIGFLLSIAGLWYLFSSKDFRSDKHVLSSGIVIGMCVAIIWYLTAGSMGQELLEEAEMIDEIPYGLGAQSLTFTSPPAHLVQLIDTGFDLVYLTLPLIAGTGILLGSLAYSAISKSFHIEWFNSLTDFINHIVSGFLMGVGGVLAMGCSVGQGITGVSTLSLGSFLALGSIIFGSALTMKVRYYKLVYEDEANLLTAILASLADMKLIPNKWRFLDRV
jgi:hypothetical protein